MTTQGNKRPEKENNIHETNFEQKIPIVEEKFSIGKKTVSEDVKIEKRWVTKTKILKVPITYEEIYVNDKKLKLSEYTDIKTSTSNDGIPTIKTIKQESKSRQISPRGELIPLFHKGKENEKIIPLWGEQITINKKMVRLEDLVITKRKVSENKKIDIDSKKEKITIRYPDGNTKQLTT
jgi:stress response protein YsnF